MKINPLLILFLFIFNLFSFSQEIIIDVKQVQGVSYISGNTSPIVAKEQALNEAKLNALRKANISEDINSNETYLTSDTDGNHQDYYTSDFYSNFKGAIKSFEITSDIMTPIETGIKRVITINAKVIKYKTVEDPNFMIDIDGIKGSYNAGNDLEFNVVSSKKCYLTIFWIDESGSGVLYPNNEEDYFLLIPNENYKFPLITDSTRIYKITMNNIEKSKETNRLLFVFTKNQIPFVKTTNSELSKKDIFSWVNSIEPSERKIRSFSYLVTN
tara:strand:+ start:197 stop:1009 length:813 start_codon:yes stop_codon:yes gene_type:complete